MLRKLLLVATITTALLGLSAGSALAASGPAGWKPCVTTPQTPTYNDNGSLKWSANIIFNCSAVQSSDVNVRACMFIGDNPGVEFCKTQIFVGVGGGQELNWIPYVTECFAGGFHWVGTRLYTGSRAHQNGTVTYSWSSFVRSPDGPGSYGQCRLP